MVSMDVGEVAVGSGGTGPGPNPLPTGLRADLERMEFEAPGCATTPEVYARLLAVYLYEDDLPSAKFLWKRIPPALKEPSPAVAGGRQGAQPHQRRDDLVHLAKVWEVGKALWSKDPSAVYAAIDAAQWSPDVAPIMQAIKDATRDRAVELIGRAYTSITLSDFARHVGLPMAEASELVKRETGWSVDPESGMVLPVRRPVLDVAPPPSEEQLRVLTDFVTSLEN